MQSYSSFSVGGTLSVNAHGITTDHCLAESVLAFHFILADGREIDCARDSADKDAQALFGLALGGYGLFGVITTVPQSDLTPLTISSFIHFITFVGL